jgi:predicted amidohydrolase YtcJ
MNRAAALFFLATTCGAVYALVAFGQHSDGRIRPAAVPLMTRASTSESPADLILLNGRIYTGDAKNPQAGAVAIRGESIVALATADADLKFLTGPKTRVLDLRGQFAMPGFNDAHVHLAGAGLEMLEVNLKGVRSLPEFQQRIRTRLRDFKPGEWMAGRGWDHTLWPEKKFPTRQDLDAVSTNQPMFFGRVDGHVAIVNSRALAIAGITRTTPDPPGGHIERDQATGEPTGMLEEDAAMYLVYDHIPPYTTTQRRRALELAINEAVRRGVTSLQDNSVDNRPDSDNFGWENLLVLQQMQREGALKARVTEWLPFGAPLARLEQMRRAGGSSGPGHPGDPWLKTGALKAFLDGSLGSRTAAMLAPYSDVPETSGILRIGPKQLEEMSIERDRAGFQLAFHAIGDRANHVALDVFAAIQAANGPRDRRDRVEHAQIVAQSDLSRFGALHIIASMQPSHLLDDERWATDRLGPDRVKGAYAWKSMQKNGASLAFGTDFPVESINPLRGLYACVTRELPGGGPAGGWHPEERLTMSECIQAYTVGSAYAEFEEQRKGTLATGMLADIVVFPRDITHMTAKNLLRTPIVMTIVGGQIVYQRP